MSPSLEYSLLSVLLFYSLLIRDDGQRPKIRQFQDEAMKIYSMMFRTSNSFSTFTTQRNDCFPIRSTLSTLHTEFETATI
jgi:hypothetical protein